MTTVLKSCQYCGKQHSTQAFISHSASDKAIAKTAQTYCCQADVFPLLFEMPSNVSASASGQIIAELEKSSVYLAVLGPEVSRRSWTQAWMAFECGFFLKARNVHVQPKQSPRQLPKMFLIEDISQSNDAAIPFFEVALLLDFADVTSWSSMKTLLRLINPAIRGDQKLWAESNNIRLRNLAILPGFRCPNPKCNHLCEVHIWIGKRVKRLQGITPDPPRTFSIKCPVCRRPANVEIIKSSSVPPDWDTKSRQPRSSRLPLPHISRLV